MIFSEHPAEFSPFELRGIWTAMQLAEGLYWLGELQRDWPRAREVMRGVARSKGFSAEQIAAIEQVFERGATMKVTRPKAKEEAK